MDLTPLELRQLREALIRAFPRDADLKQLVYFSDVIPKGIIDIDGSTIKDKVFALIQWAESHNKINELVTEAFEFNPDNPELKGFAEQHTGKLASPSILAVPCPYPGLRPFDATEAHLFYGRDEETEALYQLLQNQRFVIVSGPSGCGKSSLVYAGLLPKLASAEPGTWRIVELPLTSDFIAHSSERLGSLVTGPPNSGTPRLLLLLDQLEEVLRRPPEADTRFIDRLHHLIANDFCWIVATLRSDFYAALRASRLWPLLEPNTIFYAITTNQDSLKNVIVAQAQRCKIDLAPALISRLWVDMGDASGSLAWIQATLRDQWMEQSNNVLDLAAYESGRYLAQVLARQLAYTLAKLEPDQQTLAKRTILRLIESLSDTSLPLLIDRFLPYSDLHSERDESTRFKSTIEILVQNHLLIIDSDLDNNCRVKLAHPMLIKLWPGLYEWVQNYHVEEMMRREVEEGERRKLSDDKLERCKTLFVGDVIHKLGINEKSMRRIQSEFHSLQEKKEHKKNAREDSRERALRLWQTLQTAGLDADTLFKNVIGALERAKYTGLLLHSLILYPEDGKPAHLASPAILHLPAKSGVFHTLRTVIRFLLEVQKTTFAFGML
ncbi:MAG: ATP-binding protein [Ktedonobacteraceae bacterium]|nr:ATP-binding protein [Ktedonobacteraceae bacterium]